MSRLLQCSALLGEAASDPEAGISQRASTSGTAVKQPAKLRTLTGGLGKQERKSPRAAVRGCRGRKSAPARQRHLLTCRALCGLQGWEAAGDLSTLSCRVRERETFQEVLV